MIRYAAILMLMAVAAMGEVREVKPNAMPLPPVTPQPTLVERIEARAVRAARAERSKALTELAGIASDAAALDSASISNQVTRIREQAIILQAFNGVIADTRTNIVECAEMDAVTIAQLYMAQARKRSEDLETLAPTNTIEYLVGAGMRQDLHKQK